jgi:hypothetical protein
VVEHLPEALFCSIPSNLHLTHARMHARTLTHTLNILKHDKLMLTIVPVFHVLSLLLFWSHIPIFTTTNYSWICLPQKRYHTSI